MNKPSKCKNCQWYGKPYWSIINPCDNCPMENIETFTVWQDPTIKEKDKEIERLKNGYCELKVKCNNGECDCTNEEYDGMVEGNIKLSLEVDRLNNIIDELEYFIKTYSIPEFAPNEPHREFMETKIILNKLKELKESK